MATGIIKITVKVDPKLRRKLDTLEPKVQKRIISRAMTHGMKPARELARATAPFDSGYLAEAIAVVTRTNRRSKRRVKILSASSRFGPQFRRGRKRWPIKYIHLAELGTKPHVLGSSGRLHPGFSGHHFMRDAFRATGTAMMNRTMDKLLQLVLKELSK